METVTLKKEESVEDDYYLLAVDVTGTNIVEGRNIRPTMPTRELAGMFASKMALADVPWMLRSDETGAFLDEEAPIGDQVATGSRVVLTPKTHLGGAVAR